MTKALDLEEVRKEVIELMIKKQPYSLQLLESNFPSRYWEIIGEIILYTHKITKQQIKSALQGLLEDVENCMWLKALEDTYEGVFKLQPRKHIQEIIKKWFPDVMKDV